jgi:hypothetical protein
MRGPIENMRVSIKSKEDITDEDRAFRVFCLVLRQTKSRFTTEWRKRRRGLRTDLFSCSEGVWTPGLPLTSGLRQSSKGVGA